VDNPTHNPLQGLDSDIVHNNGSDLQIYSTNTIFRLELPLPRRVAALQHNCHHDETNRACDEANR
jgi:hypothetical protein